MKRIIAFVLLVAVLPAVSLSSSVFKKNQVQYSDNIGEFLDATIENNSYISGADKGNDKTDLPTGDGKEPVLPPSDTPSLPTEPEAPTEPETPTEPEVPTEPEATTKPEVPTEPDTPEEPEEYPEELKQVEITLGLTSGSFGNFSVSGYMDSKNGTKIDSALFLRNAAAEEISGVRPVYKYYSTVSYKWGGMNDVIFSEVMAESPLAPDVYVSSVADIGAASLRGCFAELNSFESKIKDENFIKSLSFGSGRFYAFGGDCFMDVYRAMYVMPYNTEIFASVFRDYGDSESLFKLFTEKWEYKTFISMCALVPDGVSAFVMDCNEESARGLLTSSEFDVFGTEYYDAPHAAQKALFAISDIAAVSETALSDVQSAFAERRVLFGGIRMLGELETCDSEFLGAAPIPVFEGGQDYIASVSRYAQIGALSAVSKKAQSAITYVSAANRVSADIFDIYVKKYFSGCDENPALLSYMRGRLSVFGDLDGEDVMYVLFGDDRLYSSLIDSAVARLSFEITSADTLLFDKRSEKIKYLKMIISEIQNLKK